MSLPFLTSLLFLVVLSLFAVVFVFFLDPFSAFNAGAVSDEDVDRVRLCFFFGTFGDGPNDGGTDTDEESGVFPATAAVDTPRNLALRRSVVKAVVLIADAVLIICGPSRIDLSLLPEKLTQIGVYVTKSTKKRRTEWETRL